MTGKGVSSIRARLTKLFGARGRTVGDGRSRLHDRTERLNRRLMPFFGPAQVGPYDEPEHPTKPADPTCAACGQPMSRHRVDRSTGRSRVYCPTGDPK